jgi:hypothetical protein
MNDGVDPWAFMQHLAGRLDQLRTRAEIGSARDEHEYLMEVLDPELQDAAYDLSETLRRKLQSASE